jgi:Mrp family chromosome partitioning ATPase
VQTEEAEFDIDGGVVTRLADEVEIVLLLAPDPTKSYAAATIAPQVDGAIVLCTFGVTRQCALRGATGAITSAGSKVLGSYVDGTPRHVFKRGF